MHFLKIVLFVTLTMISYGIAHDQVTARVSIEYFTIGHPPLINTENPTLIAFAWGFVATWWVALPAGVIVALMARVGTWHKITWTDLRRPALIYIAATATVCVIAGIIGCIAASRGWVWLLEPMASAVPSERHTRFLANLWAHTAAYVMGVVGTLALCGWILWTRRHQTHSKSTIPQ
jgi:hypothetical protein